MNLSAEIVSKAIAGDKEAFGEIYESVSRELYRYAFYVLRNKEDAQDAVSQCMVEAYRAISSLKSAAAFKQWIFTILSRVIKRRQKELIEKRGNEDIYGEAEIYSTQNVSGDIANALALRDALGTLSAEDRRILLLALVGGYSGKEIAQMTKLSHAAVRTRLSRVTARLRKQLGKGGNEQP